MRQPRLAFVFSAFLLCPAFSSAADALAKRLVSPDSSVRGKAITKFQRLSAEAKETYVPDLMMAVNDDDPGVRRDAQALLQEMGVQARTAAGDIKSRLSAERSALADVSQQRSPEELKAARDKEFGDMRRQLDEEKKAMGTADLREQMGESPIFQALEDPDPLIRTHAARQLSTIHPVPVKAIPTLIAMLKAKDVESRVAAAAAIGAMGPAAREAAPALIQALADASVPVRQIAAEALKQVQP